MKSFYLYLCRNYKVIPLLLCIMVIAEQGNAQLFQQDFNSSTSLASYVNSTNPNVGQFNAIASTGPQVTVAISGGALVYTRTANSAAGQFSRSTDFSPIPQTLRYQFDLGVSGNNTALAALQFKVGAGFGITNSPESNATTYGRFGVDFGSAGQFRLRDLVANTTSSYFSGTQTITWCMNNSGQSQTYVGPNGSDESIANDKMDIWVGNTLAFNDINVLSPNLNMTDLKFYFGQGMGTVTMYNFFANPLVGGIYVNDASLSGDVFTSAVGSNSNYGTKTGPYATINHAISKAGPRDTIYVDAGTYTDNVVVDRRVRIVGAGNSTLIQVGSGNGMTLNAGGNCATDRTYISQLRITGSGDGIRVNNANLRCITFDEVNSSGNTGNGIHFNVPAYTVSPADIEVKNCTLSTNGGTGFRLASNSAMDGLSFSGGQINDNAFNGISTGPSGSAGVTNVSINGISFSGNGTLSSGGHGDISFYLFNGNASISNVSVTADADYGIQLIGSTPLPSGPSGTVTLNNVTVTGTANNRKALGILNYTDASGITLNNVTLNTNPQPYTTAITYGLFLDGIVNPFNIGNTSFGNTHLGIGMGVDIVVYGANTQVDATGASFSSSNNFTIEDRIGHRIDFDALGYTGLVTWVPNNVYVTVNSFAPPQSTAPSIQRGISAATVGGTVNVGPGTFTENITVNKGITLRGMNAGVSCGGTRTAESVINGSGGATITVSADNVTINGFQIKNRNGAYAINGNGNNCSNLSIIYNDIRNVGDLLSGSSATNVHSILYQVIGQNSPFVPPGNTSNVNISDNCFTDISSSSNFNTSNTGFSSSAIGILQSVSTGVLTGLTIERNRINSVRVNTDNWPKGKIAYGIQLNTGSSNYQTTSGKIANAIIRNNEIQNLSGHISTGIALEGNTENAIVEYNTVSNLHGTKPVSPATPTRTGGGYDLSGLKVESNRFVGTLTVRNNSFNTNTFTHGNASGTGYAVSNYVSSSVGTLTLECNWYGTAAYNSIIDNASFTGKIFSKDNCLTVFAPYLTDGTDSDPLAIGFQTAQTCTAPCALSLNVSTTPENCPTSQNGTADVSVSGGTGVYTYSWNTSPEQTTQQAIGLAEGTYTVTVTDQNGCTATASGTVIRTPDSDPPSCTAAPITVDSDPGFCSAYVTINNLVAIDNCLVSSFVNDYTFSNDASDYYAIGTTTVTWTVTDNSGNTGTCTQVITVEDNEDPYFYPVVNNITVNTDPGRCDARVYWTEPDEYDNCLVISSSTSHNSGALFQIGATTVTYSVTDYQGNNGSMVFTVTVVDDEDPTISCPSDVTASATAGACGKSASLVTLGVPTYDDNCSGSSVSNDAPAFFPVGTTTVTWTVEDASGNTATCEQLVTITDDEDPTISCPSDVTASATAGACGKSASLVTLGVPTYDDNCSGSSVSNDAPAFFPVGTTTVTWTVEDASGNTATCEQLVTITDDEDPSISCPAPVSVNADAGLCTASSVNLGTPVTTDNCTTVTVSNDAPPIYAVGSTTVTWTITDGSNNSATCTQTVTVIDNQNPTITCPSNKTFTASTSTCNRIINSVMIGTGEVVVDDNCGVQGFVNSAASFQTPYLFNVGTTTVTWTVTDVNGRTASCTQDITITDDEIPQITCPDQADISANTSCQAAIPDLVAGATTSDNCGIASVTQSPTAGTMVGTGPHIVTVTVTDVNGKTNSCDVSFMIKDNNAPVITCPANVDVNVIAGTCHASVNPGMAAATDNCTPNLDIVISGVRSDALALNANYPVGVTTITWTATDLSGNSSTCVQTIRVRDNQPPVVNNCIVEIVVNAPANSCSMPVSWTAPTASDLCSPVTTISTHVPGNTFTVGITPVTYTFRDTSGNESICTFNVRVRDVTLPVAACKNIDAYLNANGTVTITGQMVDNNSTDACPLTYSLSKSTFTCADLGPNSVVLTVTDPGNNSASCNATVTVKDEIAPVISNCPASFTASRSCAGPVSWTEPTAADNCTLVSFTSSHAPGSSFPVGTTIVTYTATDQSGNVSTCSFNITILELTLASASPQFNGFEIACFDGATGSIDLSVSNNIGSVQYAWTGPNSFASSNEDLSGLEAGTYSVTITDGPCTKTLSATLSQPAQLQATESNKVNATCNGLNNGSVLIGATGGVQPYSGTGNYTGLSANTHQFTVTDANNCSSTISVEITAPASVIATASLVAPVSCFGGSDGVVNITATGGTPPYNGTGNQTGLSAGVNSFTVTDAQGCQHTVSINVTQPAEALSLSANVTSNVSCNGGNDGAVALTPNGGTAPYTYNSTATSGLTAGTYNYQVTDANGCTATASATITQPAQLTLDASVTSNVSCNGGNNGAVTLTPNGGTAPYTYNSTATSGLTAGTYNYQVTDANGCTATASATITQPSQLTLSASVTSNVSCFGGNNGSVSLTPSGGTGAHTISGDATSGLTAGTYNYQVTDANGCTATASATITQPSQLTLSASVTSNVSCFGGNNGSVSLTPSG
ncbi:MAG: HYR domain-containing protein, partial [Bacteroidetes bacterium]